MRLNYGGEKNKSISPRVKREGRMVMSAQKYRNTTSKKVNVELDGDDIL